MCQAEGTGQPPASSGLLSLPTISLPLWGDALRTVGEPEVSFRVVSSEQLCSPPQPSRQCWSVHPRVPKAQGELRRVTGPVCATSDQRSCSLQFSMPSDAKLPLTEVTQSCWVAPEFLPALTLNLPVCFQPWVLPCRLGPLRSSAGDPEPIRLPNPFGSQTHSAGALLKQAVRVRTPVAGQASSAFHPGCSFVQPLLFPRSFPTTAHSILLKAVSLCLAAAQLLGVIYSGPWGLGTGLFHDLICRTWCCSQHLRIWKMRRASLLQGCWDGNWRSRCHLIGRISSVGSGLWLSGSWGQWKKRPMRLGGGLIISNALLKMWTPPRCSITVSCTWACPHQLSNWSTMHSGHGPYAGQFQAGGNCSQMAHAVSSKNLHPIKSDGNQVRKHVL